LTLLNATEETALTGSSCPPSSWSKGQHEAEHEECHREGRRASDSGIQPVEATLVDPDDHRGLERLLASPVSHGRRRQEDVPIAVELRDGGPGVMVKR
jgi:hypothetical protein